MKPAPFVYRAPDSIDEAVALLAEYGDEAKILAGGQSLVPTMNFRLAQPAVLIDVNRLRDLDYVRPTDGGGLAIGALTRQRRVETSHLVAEHSPLVHETMPHIAHLQIRNRGTFGGSLAHADPAAELPAVCLALDARFDIASNVGRRSVEARDFFTGLFETALAPDDLLVGIELPSLAPGTGCCFQEVARRHGDFALVGVAVVVSIANDELCHGARIVFLSVGDGPVDARQAAALLVGRKLDVDSIAEAAAVASEHDIEPYGDIHASADFRRHLARVLTRRSLAVAARRALGGVS